jgi:hypothetical protein
MKPITLPRVDFCGLTVSRLVLGANPFIGGSHQNAERDREMLAYYTPERIRETWDRAEAAGINTMVTNNETLRVVSATREYLASGGRLQWIAQVNKLRHRTMNEAIGDVVRMGCKALYIHGAVTDRAYRERDEESLRTWCDHARSLGVPVGVAGHNPEAHLWVESLDIVDFHAVCGFNCGSIREGKGERFVLSDLPVAMDCIRRIRKPCIAYKIMGAGRIDPVMALESAFEAIKPCDVVNVGMHRGDRDDMVEVNVAIVSGILSEQSSDTNEAV